MQSLVIIVAIDSILLTVGWNWNRSETELILNEISGGCKSTARLEGDEPYFAFGVQGNVGYKEL